MRKQTRSTPQSLHAAGTLSGRSPPTGSEEAWREVPQLCLPSGGAKAQGQLCGEATAPPTLLGRGHGDCRSSLPLQETLRCGFMGCQANPYTCTLDNMDKLWSCDQRSAMESVPISAMHRN